jgi:putative CocE/NonD family hydrolase
VPAARTLWDCRIQMRDGVEISADVLFPPGDGPFPAVVTRTPYMRRPGAWARLVDDGYAYVSVDVRGRGDSDGDFVPFVHDADDGHDTIEWVAAQDWCDTNVGMVGISYEGLTQWWAAKAHPPHLKCIAPLAIGVARSGPRSSFDTGVPHLYWNWWFHSVSGRTQQHGGAPSWEANMRHAPLRTLDEQVGTASKFWSLYVDGSIDYLGDDFVLTETDWDGLDLPVLVGVGWWDDQTTMTTWERLQQSPAGKRSELLIGAWDHGGNKAPRATLGGMDVSASAIDTVAFVERFLARHLKGRGAGERAARCRVFRTGAMRWEDLDDWPAAGTAPQSWHLSSSRDARTLSGGGSLQLSPPQDGGSDSYAFDPDRPAPDFTNLDLFSWSDPPLDHRYRARRSDVLVYTGPALERTPTSA